MKQYRYWFLGLVLAALTAWVVLVTQAGVAAARPDNSLTYEIKANNGLLMREVTGEVTAEINGVPAEPADSFVHDGNGVTPIQNGFVRVKVDPVANTGTIFAQWRDENGNWTFRQSAFAPPDHPSGLKIGPSAASTELIVGDPVTTNVYLHGDTTAGGPVLPTVFNLLATWGPAEVTLNGQPFENPYDGPAPLWVAHTMTTVGVRNDAGQVLTADGSGIFSPMNPGDGLVYDDEIEFHLVFHDAPGPQMTGNFPPPLSFFYHLTFQDVEVSIEGEK
ncbi:MAG: hypothetical protein ACE5FD_00240 [Anaerolineae bacterium]